MRRLNFPEILLLEVIAYFGLWLANDYLGALISLIFGGIFFLILLVSLLVEWVERSKVPQWYFPFMIASTLAPALAGLIYILIFGLPDWSF